VRTDEGLLASDKAFVLIRQVKDGLADLTSGSNKQELSVAAAHAAVQAVADTVAILGDVDGVLPSTLQGACKAVAGVDPTTATLSELFHAVAILKDGGLACQLSDFPAIQAAAATAVQPYTDGLAEPSAVYRPGPDALYYAVVISTGLSTEGT
jgi:hypothetical protein